MSCRVVPCVALLLFIGASRTVLAIEQAEVAPVIPPPPVVVDPVPSIDWSERLPPGPRILFGVDYLNWWLREGRVPATLTTSSRASQGQLGQPDTQILYGNQRLPTRHNDEFAGVRGTLDWWFNESRTFGFEMNAFFLERDSTHFKAISDGSTLLALPFAQTDGSQGSYIVAGQAPSGPRNGQFVGYSRIELFGEEANFMAMLLRTENFRLDALAGARFLQMRDRTDFTSTSRSLPSQSMLFGVEDHYRTANAYYGGQLGLRGELIYGRWSLTSRAEIGLGGNDEKIREFGYYLVQSPTSRGVTPVGLTVQANNTSTFQRTDLNMVTSADLNLRYRFSKHVSISGGYTFLLWDGPMRSGDQVNTVINNNPGAPPSVLYRRDVFWAQGVNVGLTLTW